MYGVGENDTWHNKDNFIQKILKKKPLPSANIARIYLRYLLRIVFHCPPDIRK